MTRARKHLLASAWLALTLPVAAQNAAVIGDVVSSDASVNGSVLVVSTGTRVMSGSSVVAGNTTASLRLARGGEVRICPHANLSLTNSQSGRDLVLGMGTGAIETHYTLRANADTILTPDFRILLAGPGTFHFAFGADARGNTCVRSLENNTSSIIITEQMGDGVYQVRPGEQAYFHGGTIAGVRTTVPPDCGCPPPIPAVMTAQAAPLPTPAITNPSLPAQAVARPTTSPTAPTQPQSFPANSPEAVIAERGTPTFQAAEPSAPASPDNEIHIQVDAPFVFRGDEPAPPPPPSTATLRMAPMPRALMEPAQVLPPAPPLPSGELQRPEHQPAAAKPRRGVFGHIRSFFAAIFK
ncbi:MAG TPA: hypothetical protein VFM10_03200 [Terriglobales bacterium]|nr:hypothetical protein [Terriglobales bacterium]